MEPTMSDTRTISSEDAQRRLAEINLQMYKLYDETKELKTLLISRTTPKYHVGQILQRLNENNNPRNVEVLESNATQSGWVYHCIQANQLHGYTRRDIAEHLLHDVDLNPGDLLNTSPKHEEHKPKKQRKERHEEESIIIPPELQAQIDALL